MNSYEALGSYTVKTEVLVLHAEACVLQHVLSSVKMLKRSGDAADCAHAGPAQPQRVASS